MITRRVFYPGATTAAQANHFFMYCPILGTFLPLMCAASNNEHRCLNNWLKFGLTPGSAGNLLLYLIGALSLSLSLIMSGQSAYTDFPTIDISCMFSELTSPRFLDDPLQRFRRRSSLVGSEIQTCDLPTLAVLFWLNWLRPIITHRPYPIKNAGTESHQ